MEVQCSALTKCFGILIWHKEVKNKPLSLLAPEFFCIQRNSNSCYS